MKNFSQHVARDMKGRPTDTTYRYDYYTGAEKEEHGETVKSIVRLEVYYSLGGGNVWSGKNDSRGVWVSIIPMEKGPMFTSFQLTGGKGRRILAKELKRKSDKELGAVAESLEYLAPDICKLFADGLETGALSMLTGAVTPVPAAVGLEEGAGDDSEDPTSGEWTPRKQAAQDAALKAIGASNNNTAELEARRRVYGK